MKIVYDNNLLGSKECRAPWGFSLYLEEYKLLFDTGGNGRILLKNLQKANIKEIEYLFISHEHWDHIGGIDSVLEEFSNLTLFVPSSFSKNHIEDLKSLSKEVVVCDKGMRLFDNLYTTGVLGEEIPEQSLIIDSNEPTLIAGCSHFGIDEIVKTAKEIISKDISTVIGGFHLLRSKKSEIEKVIESLKNDGVKKVLPTHCSGDLAIELFKENFGNGFIEG